METSDLAKPKMSIGSKVACIISIIFTSVVLVEIIVNQVAGLLDGTMFNYLNSFDGANYIYNIYNIFSLTFFWVENLVITIPFIISLLMKIVNKNPHKLMNIGFIIYAVMSYFMTALGVIVGLIMYKGNGGYPIDILLENLKNLIFPTIILLLGIFGGKEKRYAVLICKLLTAGYVLANVIIYINNIVQLIINRITSSMVTWSFSFEFSLGIALMVYFVLAVPLPKKQKVMTNDEIAPKDNATR